MPAVIPAAVAAIAFDAAIASTLVTSFGAAFFAAGAAAITSAQLAGHEGRQQAQPRFSW